MLKFIGLKINASNHRDEGEDSHSSSSDSQYENKKYWRGIEEYDGETIVDSANKIIDSYSKIGKMIKKFDFINQPAGQPRANLRLPKEIRENVLSSKESLMMK